MAFAALGCGQGSISARGDAGTFKQPRASKSADDVDDPPRPAARWDTAYERPHAVELAVTQSVRAWTESDLPLPAECLASLTDARIEVWTQLDGFCWEGVHGCHFQERSSGRPVIQVQHYMLFGGVMAHELAHLLEDCALVAKPDHQGPGFTEAEPYAAFLIEQRLGPGTVAEVVGLDPSQ